MSAQALHSLIAHAVVDRRLCDKLLDGERDNVLSQFELDDHERAALTEIRAGSLQAFAAQLYVWMRSQSYAELLVDLVG